MDHDAVSPDPVSLDPVSIAEEAALRAGVTTTPLRFLDGLRHLSAALDTQAHLTAAGRVRVRSALVRAFGTQIHVDRMFTAVPQIREIGVRPVFITGLLRTGTTFLQNLLAQHPVLRSPRLWELMNPAGPAEPARLIAECESYVEEYYRAAPEFRAIHELDARRPEECHRLTANSFLHLIYGLRYRVPDYMDWLDGQSMTPAYQFHLAQLRCLLWRCPGDPVVLKCPSHLWHMDALAEVYPDAKVVRLHRSPAVAVPSVCSLTAVVRSARAQLVDRAEIGEYWLTRVGRALDGMGTAASVLPTPPLDIRYPDLIADPIGTAARVCDYIGVPLTERARRLMSGFIATGGRTGTQRHRYRAEDFGLQRRRLDQRFADYVEEFQL